MAHLITDEKMAELIAANPIIIGKVNRHGDDRLLVDCPGCHSVRMADYECPQCMYVSLMKKMAPIKAALKQISGLVDKAILDLDCAR